MSVLRSIGGKHRLLLVDRNKDAPFTAPLVSRSRLIIPLIRDQPYIDSVICSEEKPDVDMTMFRNFHNAGTTLVAAQMAHYNCETWSNVRASPEPWLVCGDTSKHLGFADRVIAARSPRYQNEYFPWDQIVDLYGERIMFVGLDSEYDSFVKSFGPVDRLLVHDFLDLAKAIQMCALFIGNQSSPHSIALGLGVRMISEVCLHQPDCIYKRKNVQYCFNGRCSLPDVAGSGAIEIERRFDVDVHINKRVSPPGMWQYPGAIATPHYGSLQKIVQSLESCSEEEANERIVIHNVRRCPEFFESRGSANFQRVLCALYLAGAGDVKLP